MEEIIQKLKISLEGKRPSLILGAGFSFGAENESGDKLPLGEGLVNQIYEQMFIKHPPKKEIFDEDSKGAKELKDSKNLKGLCTLLRDEDRVDVRNDFLTTIFKGASIEEDNPHYYITDYKWNKIFTLNIDDLLENIFDSKKIKYKVWNNNNDDRRNNNSDTLIIKLHGCVNNKEEGYVFDEKEYIDFLNEDNCFLRDFGDAHAKGDMIFIGTEFQENDLKTIISKYDNKGYDTSGNNYFFVMPQISDVSFKRQISSKSNFYWIPWTTAKFFEFLHENILLKNDIKKELSEKGMISLDELYLEMNQNFESKLYTGTESVFNDFYSNWDIIHPGIMQFEEKLIKQGKHIVAAVIGNSYVGKTCAAKRILIDLKSKGYLTYQFSMTSSEYIYLFLKYLKKLPENTKIAVLFEEASFYYNLIYNILFSECPKNIEQIILVTSDTSKNHFLKKDILTFNKQMLTFKVTEAITRTYAEAIYTKLKEKNWLNRPAITGTSKYDFKSYAVKINDIIEFLYNVSFGKGFEQHYSDVISVKGDEINNKYLQALVILGVLGVSNIPKRLLPSILIKNKARFDFQNFKNTFDGLIIEENGMIKLRCLRLVKKTLITRMPDNKIKNLISEIVRQTAGQFNEGDVNEWSEIFQKILSVKRLLQEDIISLQQIREVLNQIERYAEKYSFYWIQRGIAAQKDKDFELADNYFRNAIKIRSNSYQAHHALAKNLFERAIDEVDKGDESYAPYYMQEGRNELRSIISNTAYSRGLKYSIHTYVDMNIKYFDMSKIGMSEVEAEYIQDIIINIPTNDLDSHIMKIIGLFIEYCKEHSLKKYSDLIIKRHYDKFDISSEVLEEEYLIENLDIEW